MPVRIDAQGTHSGFKWVVLVMPIGHRCGYVLLPSDHPWYGKDYDDIDVQVHGGLTFGEHVKTTERFPETGFWIGFDCRHLYDAPDFDEMDSASLNSYRETQKVGHEIGKELCEAILGVNPDLIPMPEQKIRNRVYVEGQCKQLAAECREVADLQKSLEASNGDR